MKTSKIKAPINNLFESLIRLGVKVSRDLFQEMNLEKSIDINLTDAQVTSLKRGFSKYFDINKTRIVMK